MKYEAHITYNLDVAMQEEIQKACKKGWSFSAIDGDIVLGKGTKCYLTKHSDNLLELEKDLKETTIATPGWIRRKIELIVLDEVTDYLGIVP